VRKAVTIDVDLRVLRKKQQEKERTLRLVWLLTQLARKRQRKNRVKKMVRRMQLSLRERPVTSQAALAKTGTARMGMTTRGRAQTASA
jgi:uncharacterized protein (DUF2344 family)